MKNRKVCAILNKRLKNKDIQGGIVVAIKHVLKRDGSTVEIDMNKVRMAVASAMFQCGTVDYEFLETVVEEVEDEIEEIGDIVLSVESIQDIVVSVLQNSEQQEIATHYSEYRKKKERERQTAFNIDLSVERLIRKDPEVVNENANKDSDTYNTQRDLTTGLVAKAKGLKDLLPVKIANAHLKGQIHWHDLDYSPYMPMTNCCVFDAKKILAETTKIGNATLKQPKSIGVAVAQLSQAVLTLTTEQFGGISIGDFDLVLEPYAKMNYEKHLLDVERYNIPNGEDYARKKTIKDIYDAVQAYEFTVNSLASSTGQTPFVTSSFGWGTSWFAREIQKAILNVRMNKLSDGKIAIFPKLVFFHQEGLNYAPEDPNYDIKQLAIKCASIAMYPDILNVPRLVEITGHRVTPMGCRSFLNGLSSGDESIYGRNNLGVISLNLVRIGLEADGDIDKFWRIFRERMNIVKEALAYRFERVKQARPENAPLLYMQGALSKKLSINDKVEELFLNQRGTISVGYIGLYETVASLYGLDWVDGNQEAKEFSIEILKRMKKYTDKWSKEQNIRYSVYATPSESLCSRFNDLDREKFGTIEGITDKEWYTNSFHYPVDRDISPFEKLNFESVYEEFTSGGLIHYTEYPDVQNNLNAIETVWNYSYHNNIMYLGTNCPIDNCFDCGFGGEFKATPKGYECPSCGNNNPDTSNVIKRICGYLGEPAKRPLNVGKQEEIINRVKHIKNTQGID